MKGLSTASIARLFLKLGTIGFGGGLAMIGLLRHYLVEKERLIDDTKFLKGLTLGQLLPGPFVTNYVEYYGLLLKGWLGSLTAVISLLIPSFLIVLFLSFLYFRFHHYPELKSAFGGALPVVIGILAVTCFRMARVFIRRPTDLIILIISFLLLYLRIDLALIILFGGGMAILFDRLRFGIYGLDLFTIFLVFAKIGVVTFGGGYGALPLMEQEVVNHHHWLNLTEFTDGVAIGQLTPGPIAITAVFIGYRVSGIIGSLIATIAIFLPSYLMLLILCSLLRRVEDQPLFQIFFSGTRPPIIAILSFLTIRLIITTPLSPLLPISIVLYLLRTPIPLLVLLGLACGYLLA
ncbi:hypothetical protein DRP53_03650 [candidate division WOR-3 bacterium]|uniref:Chromate efflux transporter n=1 Tax=candidate division WOR-3 bacterium TaxID=2052148 RepID=A0A660SJ65_UNCW3|nr:MAG: hypothetical protein DRP53_03650 [candidate division WOR-3 bacterium]